MAKFTFTEDIETSVGKPIDFSFKKIKKLEGKVTFLIHLLQI